MSKITANKKLQTNSFMSSLKSRLTKNPDLIVFSQTSSSDVNTLKELKKFNIPLVVFGTSSGQIDKNYIIKGSLKKTVIKNFCCFVIFSILTRPKKVKN